MTHKMFAFVTISAICSIVHNIFWDLHDSSTTIRSASTNNQLDAVVVLSNSLHYNLNYAFLLSQDYIMRSFAMETQLRNTNINEKK